MHGYGRIIIIDGNNFEGEFQNNKINGYGTFTWANGDYYTG